MPQSKITPATRVIVVDDDVVDYNVIKRGFKKAHLKAPFYWARDGIEAIEILKNQQKEDGGNTPFMLLVDLNMPRMNGIELIRYLKDDALFQDSPIVVLTTSKREEDKQAVAELGVEDYIVKDELVHNFERLLKVYHQITPVSLT